MRILIRSPVEFEKILPEDWHHSIPTTRQRLYIQQTLETNDIPSDFDKRLEEYAKNTDRMILHVSTLGTKPLQQQPIFHWSIDHKHVATPCWRLETIMPHVLLAERYASKAMSAAADGKYKDAHTASTTAAEHYTLALSRLKKWSWKLPELNHFVLQTDWHQSMIYKMECVGHLCTLCVGLDRGTASGALYTVSQRAMTAAIAQLATWSSEDTLLPIAESMRYYHSADMLWNNGQYGASIHRLTAWLTPTQIDATSFPAIRDELDKVPLLLHERTQTNNGAYFDIVEAAAPLPGPKELMCTTSSDIPHPAMNTEQTDLSEEYAQGVSLQAIATH